MIEIEKVLIKCLPGGRISIRRPVNGGRIKISWTCLAPSDFLAVVNQRLALKRAGQYCKGLGASI